MTVDGWRSVTLADFIELQRGFDLPKTKRVEGPFKVLSSGEAHGWHNAGPVKGPGFVVGRATNIGRPTWSNDDYWPLNTVLFAKDCRGNDAKFAYYWFLGHDLSAYNSGSVQPMLNRNYIAHIPVHLPPLQEQRAIARVLGSLDDRIESDRRVMAAALALARALVDRTAAGHARVPYTSAISVRMGSAFKGGYFSPPGVGRPLLRIRDLKTFESATWTTEERIDETVIEPGDVVVGMDAEFRGVLWVGASSVLNQRVCSFVGLNDVGRAFVLASLEPELARQERSKTGTTVIHLNKADIDTFMVPDLTAGEHRALSRVTEPLIDLVVARGQEIRTLSRMRDVLLPQLLSGQVRVVSDGEVVA